MLISQPADRSGGAAELRSAGQAGAAVPTQARRVTGLTRGAAARLVVVPRCFLIFAAILVSTNLRGQDAAPTVYAESFRKGPTRIAEESFEVKLTPANPTYRERIKDTVGNDRYEMNITPQGPAGDIKITSWQVQLRDLHHAIYNNVLMHVQGPSQDAKNILWWLNPNPFGAVPIQARRIVKVDGFYVVMQVKNLHFTPLDSPYLDSMVVGFRFTDSDPRVR